MIPKNEKVTNHIRSAFLLFQFEFYSVINSKVYRYKPKPKKEIIDGLLKYLDISINGSLMPDATKIKYLIEWGIIGYTNNKVLGIKARIDRARLAWDKFMNTEGKLTVYDLSIVLVE